MISQKQCRIGPKMQQVVQYVTNNPGCTKFDAAYYCAPARYGNIGWMYGYRTVNRCIKAGLINAQNLGNKYSLNVVVALHND